MIQYILTYNNIKVDAIYICLLKNGKGMLLEIKL